jgi:hypothetical protein
MHFKKAASPAEAGCPPSAGDKIKPDIASAVSILN